MSWLTNPENPKARRVALIISTIGLVGMIFIRQYWLAIVFTMFLVADYFQHRTKK